MNASFSLSQLAMLVPAAAFAVGIAFGAIGQSTRFCTMGALSDRFCFGDATRLRMWLTAIAIAMLATQAAIVGGIIDLSASIYTGPRLLWAATVVGGILFGFGMVLASGCPSKALIRTGGGNIRALLVLVVMGVVALMTLRGLLAEVRVALLDRWFVELAGTQDFPSWAARAFGASPVATRIAFGAVIPLALAIYIGRDRSFVRSSAFIGGLAIGVLVALGWLITVYFGYLPEHPDTLEPAWIATNSRRPESLSFVTPVGQTLNLLMLWSDRNSTVTFGIAAAAAAGVVVGALAAALLRKEFRWESFAGVEDTANHLVGAVLMGIGGVTALGCTIGQGISELSTLAAGSFLAVAGIVAGAFAALRYQRWRIDRVIGAPEPLEFLPARPGLEIAALCATSLPFTGGNHD